MSATEDTNLNFVRQTLETAHREYDRGILESSPAQVLAFYEKWTAPGFEERGNPKGHVTDRAGMLALMAQVTASGSLGGGMVVLEDATGIAELVVDGSLAIAVTENKCRYRLTDTQRWYGVKDEEHEVETVGRWRETWRETDEGWRLQINQLLGSQTYVDGLLFAPPASSEPLA